MAPILLELQGHGARSRIRVSNEVMTMKAQTIELKNQNEAPLIGARDHAQKPLLVALMTAGFLTAGNASAIQISPCFGEKHCTDGGFNLHNGGSRTSDSTEWSGPNVSKTFFPRVGDAGGSWLYVEQGGGIAAVDNQLYLMYDYVQPAVATSFFDVFFEVKHEDYLVRIAQNGIDLTNGVWVKPTSVPSALLPDGTFDISTVWTLLSVADPADIAFGNFKGAMGFGFSPNNETAHPIAEFEVSFNSNAFLPPNGQPPPNGLYSPDPAFWSASAGGPLGDPPFSSAIFQLNPNGTTTVVPCCALANGPILQPVNPVPEPGSLALTGLGLWVLGRRNRKG